MEWNALWSPWTGPGIEHLHLAEDQEGFFVDSVIRGAIRVSYTIHCDRSWNVQNCIVHRYGARSQEIHLWRDAQGHWMNTAHERIPSLEGCSDVSISTTPFTHTLPIRRLSLHNGQSAEILVACITIPTMEIQPVKRRYTCLESSDDGGLYRYEEIDSDFTTELRVDAQGLVLDYPEQWKRVWDDSFAGIKTTRD